MRIEDGLDPVHVRMRVCSFKAPDQVCDYFRVGSPGGWIHPQRFEKRVQAEKWREEQVRRLESLESGGTPGIPPGTAAIEMWRRASILEYEDGQE